MAGFSISKGRSRGQGECPAIPPEINPPATRTCYDVPAIVSVPHPYRRNSMSKGMDSKKTDKKAPAKTMKEKKAAKKIKKAEKK